MKITLTNQHFRVPSSGGRNMLISPTTRLINERQPPEGGTRKQRIRQCVQLGIVICALTLNVLAQTDLNDQPVHPLADTNHKAVVLIFVRTDCPISNRYAPELQRLQRQFKNVRFWLVYPNDEAAAIEQHLAAFGFTRARALRDPQQTLVKLARAQVTPEAAVFVRGALIYRGRIDDRVVAFGQQRSQPKQRELSATLNAIARGAKLSFKEQPAVGCYIAQAAEKPDER